MTVRIEKPAINVREELADLRKPSGVAGEAMLRAETPQEQFNLIGAGRRNLIINGAMQVAQRGTSFTTQATSAYAMDRWINEHDASTFNLDFSQEAGPRDFGFMYAQKATVQTAATLTTAGYIIPFEQRIERNLIERLQWGTSNAQPFTLSFWIKSNRTGTYTVNLNMASPTGGTDDATARQYTIDAANTWEYKTLTFPANTTTYSGVSYNARALTLFWWMIAGSSYTAGSIPTGWENETQANRAVGCSNSTTVGDNWQITGVQLEAGKVATPFEHRSYGEELAACQRYFQRAWHTASNSGNGQTYPGAVTASAPNTSTIDAQVQFPVALRATPTLTIYRAGVSGQIWNVDTAGGLTVTLGQNWYNTHGISGMFLNSAPLAAGTRYGFDYDVDAEL